MIDYKTKHLLNRAAFGTKFSEYKGNDYKAVLMQLISNAKAAKPQYIEVKNQNLKSKIEGFVEIQKKEKDNPNDTDNNANARKQIVVLSALAMADMKLSWCNEMINSPNQLGEKMALFWHNHFATSEKRAFTSQAKLLHTLRSNATGNFGKLLREVSKSAIMIHFLNNQQNTKKAPNENFAREVMELFTLGRDKGYTEADIKEAARAFTGWKANKITGEMFELERQFDSGEKVIFGKKGNFNGDDVIDMLLEKKETAYHISRKIYTYFVNPIVDEQKAIQLGNVLYKNNYELIPMLETMFSADWFYDKKNIGSLIKSPIELLVGVYRAVPHSNTTPLPILYNSKLLSQDLFDLPNVGGWPHHREWIDSSSLLLRLQLPNAIISNEEIKLKTKEDDDLTGGEMMQQTEEMDASNYKAKIKNQIKKAKLQVDIASLEEAIGANSAFEYLQDSLLSVPIKTETKNLIAKDGKQSSLATLKRILSTPEYQLC